MLTSTPVDSAPPASSHEPEPTLALARPGQILTVVGVVGDDPLARRLVAAGIWPGVPIERIGAAPFGDPMLFRLHGYRLALRRSEAERVVVLAAGGQ